MLVVTVLRKPCDNILVRPVDLKGMIVVIVDMVLNEVKLSVSAKKSACEQRTSIGI